MRMTRWVAAAAAALLLCAPVIAQTPVKDSALPAAAPLTGAKKLRGVQGSGCATSVSPCANVSVTPGQLGKYLASDPSITAAYQPLDTDLTAIAALATQPFGRARLTDPDAATARGALGAAASGANADITSITGSAAKWTTGRTVTASGDVGWTFSIDGSANVTASTTLASTGVTAGSYGGALTIPTVTVDGKGRITSAGAVSLGTVPIGQGGTGDTGTAWTIYTPTLSCGTGSLTSAAATGRYKAIGKTVFLQVRVSTPNVGSCNSPLIASLPVGVANTGSGAVTDGYLLTGREDAVAGYMIQAKAQQSNSSLYIFKYDNGFAAQNNAILVISGTYESN